MSDYHYPKPIDGFTFTFVPGGVVVPPDAPLADPKYVEALSWALSLYSTVAAYENLEEYRYHWYESVYYRNNIARQPILVAAQTLKAQCNILIPDWVDQFIADIEAATAESPVQAKSAPRVRQPKPGYVYLLQSPTGTYKIGKAKDPADRLGIFTVKLPFEVEFLALIPTDDMGRFERELQTKYADKLVNGEWFALTPDDVEYIKGLAHNE